MKHTLVYLFSFFALLSCGVAKPENSTTASAPYEYVDSSQQQAGITGRIIYGESDEPAPNVKVSIEGTTNGCITDFDGFFRLNNIDPGVYTLVIEAWGYETKRIEKLEVKPNKIVKVNTFLEPQDTRIELLKPIIYLYPEETTQVSVKLNFDGDLAYTYPKYQNGWSVQAASNGELRDETGRTYYGLFWEGPARNPLIANCGAVVASDTIISYLENSLEQLGLSEREANEFIVFWYPQLSRSPYNLIHFSFEEYEAQASLLIEPTPQTVIRVMMMYKPLKEVIAVSPQVFPKKPVRKGFTVVEWGGCLSAERDF